MVVYFVRIVPRACRSHFQGYFPFQIQDHETTVDFPVLPFRTHTGALVSNTVGVLSWMVIAMVMYYKKFFVTL